jgi:hypothetical protein
MSVPLSQLLADSTEKVRNSTTGALDNTKRTRAANRTLQDLQDYADWVFTRRTVEFEYIDGVSEYSLENYIGTTCLDNDGTTSILDFKATYDLRVPDTSHNPFDAQDVKEVRANLRNYKSLNQYGAENGILVINYARQTSALISSMDSLTEDGTWAASGDATNLTIDDVEYKQGSGCLNFDVSAGTSLVVSNTTLTAQNYETLQNKSHIILKVYLPTITNFTNIAVRWGNDLTANYWEKTETVPAGNTDLKAGWNTFAFSWGSATETGSPDSETIDSFRITLTYSSATTDTDFRLDDLRIGASVDMELEYYSLAMVKNASGAYQLEFNADDVTQTDTLLGDSIARRCVVQGMTYELFEILGGKSERDRTDSYSIYKEKKMELLKKAGVRIKRAPITLKFPSRRGRF